MNPLQIKSNLLESTCRFALMKSLKSHGGEVHEGRQTTGSRSKISILQLETTLIG